MFLFLFCFEVCNSLFYYSINIDLDSLLLNAVVRHIPISQCRWTELAHGVEARSCTQPRARPFPRLGPLSSH